jgi:hypothetical protein
MLIAITVVIVLAVGYAFFLQGLLTSFCMLVNVFLAGLVAFNFWEPLASELEKSLAGTFAQGFEDWICLVGIFAITLTLLRVVTNAIAPNEPEIIPMVQQAASALCGLLAGYLVAGFLVCAMQTLPLPEDFLGFSVQVNQVGGARRFLPPDRVWLALMQRGSLGPLYSEGDGFDPRGYFELGYARHRRYGNNREPLKYSGEDWPIDHGDR